MATKKTNDILLSLIANDGECIGDTSYTCKDCPVSSTCESINRQDFPDYGNSFILEEAKRLVKRLNREME